MNRLQKWFGTDKEEMWRKLCAEIGADYVSGGVWKGDKVQAQHGEWTITLQTFAVCYGRAPVEFTCLRALYHNPDGFQFTVYRQHIFSDIAKWLGMQDVEVGYPEFDRDFVIKGTDEAKLRALFASARLRELIAAQPQIHFTVKDNEAGNEKNLSADTDELSFTVIGVITDVTRLKLLFELFSETLDQLCRIGSASENALKTAR